MILKQFDTLVEKNDSSPLSYTIQNKYFKIDIDLNAKTKISKFLNESKVVSICNLR
jgi:hypothetical protein